MPSDAAAPQVASVAEVIAGLARRASGEPVRLLAFTDEELAALDSGPDRVPVTPGPWLDTKDDAAREVALQVALRGLAARGIALPGPTGEDGTVTIVTHPDIAAALAMRRTAEVIVSAQRQASVGPAAGEDITRMLFRCGDGVLHEDISPVGLHGFVVTTVEDAAARLAELADPKDAAGDGAAGAPSTVALADVAAGNDTTGLGGARYVTSIAAAARPRTGADVPETAKLTVYALAEQVLLAEPIAADDPVGPQMLRVTGAGAGALRGRLAALLDPDRLPALP